MHSKKISLTREELYDLVWSTPMRRLAPQYGLSDVGLAKLCRRHEIPLPERGYWQKLRAGKRPRRRRLPPTSGGPADRIVISPGTPVQQKPDDLPPELRDLYRREQRTEALIEVPGRVRSPHPEVQRAGLVLRGARADGYGILQAGAGRCLDIRVTKGTLGRAMRMMNALLRAFKWSQRHFVTAEC